MPFPSYYSSSYMPSGSFNSALLGRHDYSSSFGRTPAYVGSGFGGGFGFGGGYAPVLVSPYGTGPYGGGGYCYAPQAKYMSTPMPTISESGALSSQALNRRTPRSQNYIPPIGTSQFSAPLPRTRLTTWDTENIDVTSPREAKPKEIARERNESFGTIRRGRTVIRIQTKQLKENPYLVDDVPKPKRKPKKTAGEKLKEKYMVSSVKKRRQSGYRRPTLTEIRLQQGKTDDEMEEDDSLTHEVYKPLQSFLDEMDSSSFEKSFDGAEPLDASCKLLELEAEAESTENLLTNAEKSDEITKSLAKPEAEVPEVVAEIRSATPETIAQNCGNNRTDISEAKDSPATSESVAPWRRKTRNKTKEMSPILPPVQILEMSSAEPIQIEAVIPWRKKTLRKPSERPLSAEVILQEGENSHKFTKPIEVVAVVPWRRKTRVRKTSELPEDVNEIVKEMDGMDLNSDKRLSVVEFNFILPSVAAKMDGKNGDSAKAYQAVKLLETKPEAEDFRTNYKLMRNESLTLKIPTKHEDDMCGSPDYWADRRSSFCSRRINTINESVEMTELESEEKRESPERPGSPDFWLNRGCSFVRRRDFVKAVAEEASISAAIRHAEKAKEAKKTGQISKSKSNQMQPSDDAGSMSKVEKSRSNDKLGWCPSWRTATHSHELMKQTAVISDHDQTSDLPKKIYERSATKALKAKLSETKVVDGLREEAQAGPAALPQKEEIPNPPTESLPSVNETDHSSASTNERSKSPMAANMIPEFADTTGLDAKTVTGSLKKELRNGISEVSDEGFWDISPDSEGAVPAVKELQETPADCLRKIVAVPTECSPQISERTAEAKVSGESKTNAISAQKSKKCLQETQDHGEVEKATENPDNSKTDDSLISGEITIEDVSNSEIAEPFFWPEEEEKVIKPRKNIETETTISEFDERTLSIYRSKRSKSTEGSISTASSTLSTGTSSSGSRRMPSPPSDDSDEDDGNTKPFQQSENKICPAKGRPKYRCYHVHDFQFLKVLGKGSFGKVLLAELKGTESYYAVKCLKKDVVLEDDDVECTMIERKVLLMGSKHPYLCHLLCTFQTDSHLFFVMEYLNGGDLMFHIQQSGRFSEERGRFYAAEIVSGLKFLHKKGIIYRDLKLDNILLDFEGHVRIADFGMCKLQIFLDKTADTFCGTPDYMAPEIIKGMRYNQCVDWWAFGVLLYEMIVGQSPFSGCDEEQLFWSICNEPVHFPRFLSRDAKRILELLLEKDACRRLGTSGIVYGDVKDQLFFSPIDWDLLEKGELEPPFKPKLRDPLDVKYFDTTFTKEIPRLTPVDKEILRSMDQSQFDGFSYTNPHTTD